MEYTSAVRSFRIDTTLPSDYYDYKDFRSFLDIDDDRYEILKYDDLRVSLEKFPACIAPGCNFININAELLQSFAVSLTSGLLVTIITEFGKYLKDKIPFLARKRKKLIPVQCVINIKSIKFESIVEDLTIRLDTDSKDIIKAIDNLRESIESIIRKTSERVNFFEYNSRERKWDQVEIFHNGSRKVCTECCGRLMKKIAVNHHTDCKCDYCNIAIIDIDILAELIEEYLKTKFDDFDKLSEGEQEEYMGQGVYYSTKQLIWQEFSRDFADEDALLLNDAIERIKTKTWCNKDSSIKIFPPLIK